MWNLGSERNHKKPEKIPEPAYKPQPLVLFTPRQSKGKSFSTPRPLFQLEPHLFEGQQHELLSLGDLHEVLEDVFVGRLEEVAAGVGVSKATDAQAVGGVELAEQELAASVPHTIELKQAGSREKGLAGGKRRKGKKPGVSREEKKIFTLVLL